MIYKSTCTDLWFNSCIKLRSISINNYYWGENYYSIASQMEHSFSFLKFYIQDCTSAVIENSADLLSHTSDVFFQVHEGIIEQLVRSYCPF